MLNRFKKWTFDGLIEAYSDAIYEYQGIDTGVSRRLTNRICRY
ncbi:hypothetical protein ACFQZI_15705 [Mucilaginibacter lutimaris]|uniref:Uncharacterized protein n=1 Tax=Mucilaginibacter lutimaris TaxID=931629 RepID=A0ABW2ZJ98_9SPHI